MKIQWKGIAAVLLCTVLLTTQTVLAREGDCGYEGGISTGEVPNKTIYDYQEVIFITGEPLVLKGTVSIRKSLKQDVLTSTYVYSLKNTARAATMTRTLVYTTRRVKESNGQTTENTVLSGTPSEIIKVGSDTYQLKSYDFSRSNLIDPQPAVNYYAGNIWGKKVYQIGTTAAAAGIVTVENTGDYYGYEEYWGMTQLQTLQYFIQSERKRGEKVDKWGGTANVTLSSTTTKQLKYVENEPDTISFEGGYLETQHNLSALQYESRLPQFDAGGISTDKVVPSKDSLQLETFPVQKRLPVYALDQIRGHWAENDVRIMYGLGVFTGNSSTFSPEKYMTRAEFATSISQAAKQVPADPLLQSKLPTRPSAGGKKEPVVSPFGDVSTSYKYFNAILDVYNRGILNGGVNNNFYPERYITVADAVTTFIRALGLESMAPNPAPVSIFKDGDKIPEYARKAVYVAAQIGLVKGDEKGYLKPDQPLTQSRAAAMLNRFITYMRSDLRKDYMERMVGY